MSRGIKDGPAQPIALTDGQGNFVAIDGDGKLAVDVVIDNIELGDVELGGEVTLADGENTASISETGALLVSLEDSTVIIDDSTPIDVAITNASLTIGLPSGAATAANQDTEIGLIGSIGEIAPSTDTQSSGLNGRLQRVAQRITSLIALFPTSLGQKTKANSLAVTLASDEDDVNVNVTNTVLAIDDSTPIDVNITNASLTIDDSTPIDVNITSDIELGAVSITDGEDTANVTETGQLEVAVIGTISIDDSTPIDVNITSDIELGAVSITDGEDTANVTIDGELEVFVKNSITIDDSTPIDVNITSELELGAVTITDGEDTVNVTSGNQLEVAVTAALPSGTNNIGDVDVLTLPALPSGSNEIGRVRLTDGVETASINASNQLEVAVANSVAIDDSTPIDVAITNASLTIDDSTPISVDPGTVDIRITDGVEIVSVNSSNQLEVAVGNSITIDDDTPIDVSVTNPIEITDGANTVLVTEDGELEVFVKNSSLTVDGTLTVDDSTPIDINVTNASLTVGLPSGASTLSEQQTQTTRLGATDETAPGSDTATSGLNGRLQRVAQRITSLIGLLPTSLGQKTKANSLAVTLASDEDEINVNVTNANLVINDTTPIDINVTNASLTVGLPSGASTLSEQQTQTTRIGALDETAPGSDTASSGLNGRLQRIAQRITSLIALFPTSLGQKTKANSFPVTLASDEDAINVGTVAAPTTIIYGQVEVETAGTAVALASTSTPLSVGVTVKSLQSNSNWVYVGDSSVDNSSGFVLLEGEQIFITIDNLNKVYVDAEDSSQWVAFIAS